MEKAEKIAPTYFSPANSAKKSRLTFAAQPGVKVNKKMSRWPLAEHRRFEKIAATSKSLEEIVERTGRSPESIRRMAVKLGIELPKVRTGRIGIKNKP